jgi:predicted metal-dependent peptidase
MERMIKGRVGLISREPFFATLALSQLTMIEDTTCKTTWCDGRRLGFNPEHVMSMDSVDQVESILAHHVTTCALGHPFRRGGRDEKTWNEASDHVVNGYISKAGFKLPDGSLYDSRFDGQYIEQVYHQLKQEEMPEEEGDDDQTQEPGDAGAGDGTGSEGDGDPTPGDAAGAGATGEVRDATSEGGSDASEAELAEQSKDWETAVAQASQAARGAGRLSGNAEHLANTALSPKVDWREALQRKLKSRSKDDYSFRRPSKRSYTMGFILPSLDAPRCGPLGFAIDVSGSIRQSEIDQFIAEIEDARQTVNPKRVHVWAFDDGITGEFVFEAGEPVEIERLRKGGGTSFVAPVEKANELEEQLEILVFLTDLDSSRFAPEPDYEVVWITTLRTEAPYGDVIRMV